ncbi:hypothetical protein OIU77_005767 [Salix suchowensis]|uniref:Uncharacterized protein n=1 Tax=Salix suchowensis TaxID=1278906 RepID=A0ABQ9AT75_9ROSI|nr:hypothetical protein OIU77_005767 [Salix suchowensis]
MDWLLHGGRLPLSLKDCEAGDFTISLTFSRPLRMCVRVIIFLLPMLIFPLF